MLIIHVPNTYGTLLYTLQQPIGYHIKYDRVYYVLTTNVHVILQKDNTDVH